jgi:hypothetical protein
MVKENIIDEWVMCEQAIYINSEFDIKITAKRVQFRAARKQQTR